MGFGPEVSQHRRVLVTGGSGFIGTNTVEAFLRDRCSVLNIDLAAPRNRAHAPFWRKVDILDMASLKQSFTAFQPDLVVHLAARADLDERSNLAGYAANIQGVSNVVAAILSAGSVERSFFASSRLVGRLGYMPKHDRDYNPSTLYGLSKTRGEEIVRSASTDLGTWVILRPTGIWGPWFGIPYKDFFKAIQRGLYVHPAGCDVRKAYGYVENTVYQLQRLASVPTAQVHGRTLWIADYPAVRVRAWARLIQDALGARPIRSVPVSLLRTAGLVGDVVERFRPGLAPLTSFRVDNMVTDMLYDTDPLEAIVGPLPCSLEEGVERTVAWMQRMERRSAR